MESAADSKAPSFLIGIDTEGDNIWSRPSAITTENSRFLPRFQELCERHGMRPTWLTNYEMTQCPVYREFASDFLRRNTGELGMHLHSWNSPPIVPLTANDMYYRPYLIEFPAEVIEAKVEYITKLLRDTFSTNVVSHRAGRWSFNSIYANALIKCGYLIDCSVTPGISWHRSMGNPEGIGGTDYTRFPKLPYFISPDNIALAGQSPLLEVPNTIIDNWSFLKDRLSGQRSMIRKGLDRIFPPIWLRPNGRNLDQLLRLIDWAQKSGAQYVLFTLHSSEMMPGCSPTFPTAQSIEKLYEDMEILLKAASEHFKGQTLGEFRTGFTAP